MPTLTAPHSPGARARSVSQPLREGIETDFFTYVAANDKRGSFDYRRSASANSNSGSFGRSSGANVNVQGLMPQPAPRKGRTRSGSLVTVTEVGGDDGDNVNDRVGLGANHNAAWVDSPGAWVIHPVLILGGKLLVDAIPGMEASLSWTIVNLGYMIVSSQMGRPTSEAAHRPCGEAQEWSDAARHGLRSPKDEEAPPRPRSRPSHSMSSVAEHSSFSLSTCTSLAFCGSEPETLLNNADYPAFVHHVPSRHRYPIRDCVSWPRFRCATDDSY